MAHIHTEPGQHDFTVSAFIIRTDTPEPTIMLHMHKKLHMWMQFGGHIELHEDPWQALTHEILEEAGYDMDQLDLFSQYTSPVAGDSESKSHPIPFSVNTHPITKGHNHTDLSYAFSTSESPRHKLAENESSSIQLFTRKDIENFKPSENPANVRNLSLFLFDTLLPTL